MSFSGVFHAESKYRALVLLQIFVPTTYLVLLLLFWLYLNLSVEYAIISNTVANLIACVLAIYLYKKSYPIQDKCKLVWTFKDCFFFINKCFKIHASSVLQIIVSNIDKYLISFLFSSKDLGYYIVASTLSLALLNSLMNSFVTLLLPRFAGNRLSKEIYLEMRKALTVLFLISFLIVIAIITTSKYIIPFVYGKSFSNSIYLSQIVAVSSLFVVLKSAFIRFVRCLQIEGKDVSFYFADIISIFCLVVSAYVYDQFSTLSTVIIVVLFGISNAIGLMYLLSHYFLKGSYCK
jgi:O-antigen/teichoic acid export membrane protein